MVTELFEFWIDEPEELPEAYFAEVESEGLARVVADYIAGMTDNFILLQYADVRRRVRAGMAPSAGLAQLSRALTSAGAAANLEVSAAKSFRSLRVPVVQRLGHRPFTAVTRVRIPSGTPNLFNNFHDFELRKRGSKRFDKDFRVRKSTSLRCAYGTMARYGSSASD